MMNRVKKEMPEGTKQDNILCNCQNRIKGIEGWAGYRLNTIKGIKGWAGKRWK